MTAVAASVASRERKYFITSRFYTFYKSNNGRHLGSRSSLIARLH